MRLLILQSRNGTNGEDEIHGHEQNQHNVGSREWTKIELIEGFWLTKQNSQPPFFTTHPESILIFEQEKRDSRGGLTTPDSRIRLSQERLSPRKCCRCGNFEGLGNGFERLGHQFRGSWTLE